MVGKNAPDFVLPDISGKPLQLSELSGKTVVLVFWDRSSRLSVRHFVQLAKVCTQYEDLEIIGISMSQNRNTINELLERE